MAWLALSRSLVPSNLQITALFYLCVFCKIIYLFILAMQGLCCCMRGFSWRRQWHPTPVLLPGKSQGRGSLVGCWLWCHTESDMTEVTQQQQQQGFSSCSKRELLFIVVPGLLTAVASLTVEHRLSYFAASLKVLLGPRIKPVSPALAGGFSTPGSPGKSSVHFCKCHNTSVSSYILIFFTDYITNIFVYHSKLHDHRFSS